MAIQVVNTGDVAEIASLGASLRDAPPDVEQLGDDGPEAAAVAEGTGNATGQVSPPETANDSNSDIEDILSASADLLEEELEVPPLGEILAKVRDGGLYDDEAVLDAVTSLCTGHLMIAGPPGTGKTILAQLLADAFNARLITVTANPEWSVYDVLGSLSLTSSGKPQPRDGCVTKAIASCIRSIQLHKEDPGHPQATWIMIDEINRCEIDRAFGALFTALSGGQTGSFPLEHREGHPLLSIPRRFRIIAPLNSYDTRFVSAMSGALKRRFARIRVLPPEVQQGQIPAAEFDVCLRRARNRVERLLETPALEAACDAAMVVRTDFCTIAAFLRGTRRDPLFPIGTAHLIDLMTSFLVSFGLREADDTQAMRIMDEAIATRLISSLETDRSRSIVTQDFIDAMKQAFPGLVSTHERFEAFQRGRD